MWNDLTMQQRADIISMAVKAGMKDLNSIKSFYNESVGSSREYKKGGYLDWKEKASNYKHLDIDNDNTYDYEGWYNENPERAWNLLKDDPNAHFDDRYKTVYHPTFSTQSKYSGVRDDRFNPQGLIGGTWSEDGHTFIMSPDGYRGPVSMDERKTYLENAEDYGVQLREANGSLPIYDNTIWGGVLSNVTIRPKRFEDGGIIDGGTPFEIIVTGKDRRPAWKRMYQNLNLVGKKKYRSLSGKVFNTKEEAIRDNTDAKYGRGIYASKDITHSVISGDTLWGIAKANNIDVNTLRRLNPNIKGDLIHIGDKIKVGETSSPTLHDVRKEWEKEKVLNTDNLKAIQGVKHKDNYVVIDKLNGVLTVYNKDNQPLYSTSNISTGKSGNDYNTITYVDKNGKIRSGAGNESTPAGITKITGTGVYHGFPSFTRGRHQGSDFEDIASSLHFGETKDKKASNGCVRLDRQSLQDLSNFVGIGTDVYTLPEKKGSRFKVKDGKLSFVADNPYGEQSGDKRYWDDYNTYTDKSYSPLTIVDRKKSNDLTYSKNRKAYANAIANSKERLQQKFNIDSDTYNRIASLALGIAEQETKYGTSRRKAIKDLTPDFVLDGLRGNNNRSRGITQIKLHGDNQEMRDVYSQLGITDESLDSPENAAIATMARLSQMYNTEVLGRNFTGAEGATIDPYDALLYKWMGRNSELSNHTATPELNNYINNVKRYQDDFGLYTMRADGGPIHIAPSKKGTFTAAASKHGKSVQEFASQVLAHPENYSLTMRKKANFARNASHWKH